jgi:hypothetical protein
MSPHTCITLLSKPTKRNKKEEKEDTVKLHPKNVWQSPENPLAHPKCISHL